MTLNMHTQDRKLQVIAIAAGKGGVGKSTVTANLARALCRQGHAVGVLDADVYGPSMRHLLPEDQSPSQKGPTLVPAVCSGGIRMLSMAYFRKDNEATAVRAPIANGLIQQFINQVEWGPLDYLLIDFPPGTGDVQLTLCQKANLSGALMVTTPQEIAILDVRKAIHLFEDLNVPLIGVVENMSYFLDMKTGETHDLFGKGGGQRLAEEKGIPFLGQIPLSPTLSACGDLGTSLFEEPNPEAIVASKAFLALAENVKGRLLEGIMRQPCEVAEVVRVDAHTLSIRWVDGFQSMYRVADLQKRCPCAGCVHPADNQRQPDVLKEEVSAMAIRSVGRYALQIQFSSGCSAGIYPFSFLRQMTASLGEV